jgi:hypothetical protein
VLDALAVERIVSDGAAWRHQQVTLHQGALRLEPGAPLEPEAAARLQPLGLAAPGAQRPAGWCSELHPGLEPWLAACGAALGHGRLLVIDYALEAWRYYAPSRSEGTLMAYREQRASGDPLLEPGAWDLTAHLCIDSLVAAADASGWQLEKPCSPWGWPSACTGCSIPVGATCQVTAVAAWIWPMRWPAVRPCCGWWIPPPWATSAGWLSSAGKARARAQRPACSCRTPIPQRWQLMLRRAECARAPDQEAKRVMVRSPTSWRTRRASAGSSSNCTYTTPSVGARSTGFTWRTRTPRRREHFIGLRSRPG